MNGGGRVTIIVVALAGLIAPASAHAGTATVKETTEGRGDETVQYVQYTGGAEANKVTAQVAVNSTTGVGTATLTDLAGATPGAGCVRPVAANLLTVRCTLGNQAAEKFVASEAFRMSLGAGDDTAAIVNSPTTTARLDGGPGNDVLNPGTGIDPGAAEDAGLAQGATLIGGPGNDIEVGGSGDDEFDESGPRANGSDLMDGGPGVDIVDYGQRKHSVRADLQGDRDDGEKGENDQIKNVENLSGGKGNDRLTGNSGPNELAGQGGTDIVKGGGGDDGVHAGDIFDFAATSAKTKDRLEGGPGDDFLTASGGANRLLPGTGADEVVAGGGNDRISARDRSTDAVTCGRGKDRVSLDARDTIEFGCERVARKGRPRAVLVGHLDLLGSATHPYAEFGAACPVDFPGVCRARLDLFKNGKLIGTGKAKIRHRASFVQTLRAKLNSRGRALFKSLHGGSTRIKARVKTRVSRTRSRLITSTETLDAGEF